MKLNRRKFLKILGIAGFAPGVAASALSHQTIAPIKEVTKTAPRGGPLSGDEFVRLLDNRLKESFDEHYQLNTKDWKFIYGSCE